MVKTPSFSIGKGRRRRFRGLFILSMSVMWLGISLWEEDCSFGSSLILGSSLNYASSPRRRMHGRVQRSGRQGSLQPSSIDLKLWNPREANLRSSSTTGDARSFAAVSQNAQMAAGQEEKLKEGDATHEEKEEKDPKGKATEEEKGGEHEHPEGKKEEGEDDHHEEKKEEGDSEKEKGTPESNEGEATKEEKKEGEDEHHEEKKEEGEDEHHEEKKEKGDSEKEKGTPESNEGEATKEEKKEGEDEHHEEGHEEKKEEGDSEKEKGKPELNEGEATKEAAVHEGENAETKKKKEGNHEDKEKPEEAQGKDEKGHKGAAGVTKEETSKVLSTESKIHLAEIDLGEAKHMLHDAANGIAILTNLGKQADVIRDKIVVDVDILSETEKSAMKNAHLLKKLHAKQRNEIARQLEEVQKRLKQKRDEKLKTLHNPELETTSSALHSSSIVSLLLLSTMFIVESFSYLNCH